MGSGATVARLDQTENDLLHPRHVLQVDLKAEARRHRRSWQLPIANELKRFEFDIRELEGMG